MSVALVIAGSSIFLFLGLAHAVFTLQSTPDSGPMMPTDPAVRQAMSVTGGLGLAPEMESSLFRAWIGFNLSHSLGVVAIAAIVIWHGIDDLGAAVDQTWFVALVAVVPVLYFAMAITYWFDKPRDGIAVGTLLVWAGVIVELM